MTFVLTDNLYVFTFIDRKLIVKFVFLSHLDYFVHFIIQPINYFNHEYQAFISFGNFYNF